jgi:hypothetical protein
MKTAKAKQAREASLSVLVTAFDSLTLALPMTGVQKVTPLPTVFRSGETLMGVGYVDDREIIVVDLHYHLYGTAYPRSAGYLVKLQRPDGNLYGVLIATLPVIQDIPLSSLRALPADHAEPTGDPGLPDGFRQDHRPKSCPKSCPKSQSAHRHERWKRRRSVSDW